MAESRSNVKRKIATCIRCMLACIVVLTGIGLWYWHSLQPHRVHRKHSSTVSEEFKYLTRRVDFSFPDDVWLSRKQAEQDLDELEWLLENRYSYLRLKGVNYRDALDSIRNSLGNGISGRDFRYQLTKFIALFGDGHSKVGSSWVSLKSICSKFSPFLIEESKGRLVAFKADRTDFVEPEYPYLRKLDGLPVDVWLNVAKQLATQGSPQYQRYYSIRNLRYIGILRKELSINESDTILVELESEDGSAVKKVEIQLLDKSPVYGMWPRNDVSNLFEKHKNAEYKVLSENIGYLRIYAMLDDPNFLDSLVLAMDSLANTNGLIIDVRGNGGGRRTPLNILYPYFVADNTPPVIVNIAAYRLGLDDIEDAFKARYLYNAFSSYFSEEEKNIIAKFAATFQPEWTPPPGEFGEWHYFLLDPRRDQKTYYYDNPVVILMNHFNFSATDIFLGAFKGLKNVTLIGLPSGGGSGCRADYRLENSHIKIYLSSMASFRNNGQLYDGNGIQPDIVVEPIPTDFIGKTDSVLDFAVNYFSRE